MGYGTTGGTLRGSTPKRLKAVAIAKEILTGYTGFKLTHV